MNYKKYVSSAVTGVAFAAFAVVVPLAANAADAATANVTASTVGQPAQGQHPGGWGGRTGGQAGMAKPSVFGKVAGISGTTLTVTEAAHPSFGAFASSTNSANAKPAVTTVATTTYTVNAASATVFKNNATSTVASIAVGDTVMVQGTVSGTSVTATTIRDGVVPAGMGMMNMGGRGGMHNRMASSTNAAPVSPITGNGQPVVAGSISSINGSAITITNKSNVSYTVDVSNAKIVEGQNTVTASNLSVGDSVIVQGTVSGTSVTASSVIDQKAPAAGSTASSTKGNPDPGQHGGILGSIGGFFMHIFGF